MTIIILKSYNIYTHIIGIVHEKSLSHNLELSLCKKQVLWKRHSRLKCVLHHHDVCNMVTSRHVSVYLQYFERLQYYDFKEKE